MVENGRFTERLYLAKGETDECNIYVDTIPLPQHQYDGIRFLYKQFRKGKSGVILNDPSGYGKRLQTVLFLNAVSPILSLPTLILCSEGKEDMWMQQFYKWSNIGSDISVQHGNEYTKSMCLIGTFVQLSVLSRREWGIVVVDDNNVSRDVLRSGIGANYKIWITTIHMKKNLQTFSMIYKWLFPRDRFIVENFQTNKKTPSALLANSTKLDAFLEDIVIRRRGLTVPLEKLAHIPEQPKVSRKNKDATGKKIKRSKPLPASDHDTSGESEEIGIQSPDINITNTVLTKNGQVANKKENINDFVVNIENQVPMNINLVKENILTPSDIVSDSDNVEKGSIVKDKNEIREKSNDFFKDSTDKVIDIVPKTDPVTKTNSQDDILNIFNSDNILSQNIIIKYDSDTPDTDNEIFDDGIPVKKAKFTNELDLVNNTSSKVNEILASEDIFSMDTIPSDKNSKKTDNHHDIKSDNNSKNTDNHQNIKSKTTEININAMDVDKSENILSNDSPIIEVKNETKMNDLIVSKNEVEDKINISESNKTEKKLDGIELKMKQMEELAMKKFKGSFLDSMF